MSIRAAIISAIAAISVAITSSAIAAPKSADSYLSNDKNLAAAFARTGEPLVLDTPIASGPVFRHSQQEYSLYLFQCAEGVGCKAMQLRACYPDHKATAAKVNQWNSERVVGRFAIDSRGRLCADLVHYMPDGKINDATLTTVVQIFREVRIETPKFFNGPTA